MSKESIRGLVRIAAAAWLLSATTGIAHAGLPGVVIQSAHTLADGLRDGVATLGETTRDFFLHGHDAAEDTWERNVARVRWHAWRNVDRVKAEAGVTASNDDRYRDEPSRDDVPLDEPEPEDGLE